MKRSKQRNLFGNIFAPKEEEQKYTLKIEPPTYEPTTLKPSIRELYNKSKTRELIHEIKDSNLPIEEKAFLLTAAERHTVFNYEKIADYYASASKEMQALMEKSALVIIDFDKAIENGYIQLCTKLYHQFLEEYEE